MMNIREGFVSSSRIVINLVICCLVVTAVGIGNGISQETKTIRKNTAGSSLVISTYVEIPEATEQCAPAECDWWKRLREAGNNLQRKGDEKSTRKFVMLFLEGIEKSYRIPLKDRPPQVLISPKSAPLNPGVRMKNGEVAVSVEFRADGSVGEIKLVKGLRSDMDERCIQAARQNIFLPALKNGKFVTDWRDGRCGFWSQNGID